MAGVDARGGQVAIHGWQETACDYIGWAKTFESLGAGSLAYTNVDVEGLQKGIAAGPVPDAIGSVHIPVVVAAACPGVQMSPHCGTPGGTGRCSARRCTAERLTFQRL